MKSLSSQPKRRRVEKGEEELGEEKGEGETMGKEEAEMVENKEKDQKRKGKKDQKDKKETEKTKETEEIGEKILEEIKKSNETEGETKGMENLAEGKKEAENLAEEKKEEENLAEGNKEGESLAEEMKTEQETTQTAPRVKGEKGAETKKIKEGLPFRFEEEEETQEG